MNIWVLTNHLTKHTIGFYKTYKEAEAAIFSIYEISHPIIERICNDPLVTKVASYDGSIDYEFHIEKLIFEPYEPKPLQKEELKKIWSVFYCDPTGVTTLLTNWDTLESAEAYVKRSLNEEHETAYSIQKINHNNKEIIHYTTSHFTYMISWKYLNGM